MENYHGEFQIGITRVIKVRIEHRVYVCVIRIRIMYEQRVFVLHKLTTNLIVRICLQN